MTFDADQRGVVRGMAAGLALTLLAVATGLLLPAMALPGSEAMADRLAFAARCAVVPALWVVVTIGAVARGRFVSPRDIAGSAFGTPSEAVAIGRAILQNTLEQALIAVLALFALATLLDWPALGLLPWLVLLFSIGRVAFWGGYRHGAAARAFGFATTFYPNAIALFAAAAIILVRAV